MDPWRLITTWGAAPSFNMGLDEALLLSTESPPTLRFYSWSPDTLSLGYFQRHDDLSRIEKALSGIEKARSGIERARSGIERVGAVVRRITGGGAIHHVNELTFSFTASLGHPLYQGGVNESYTRIHEAIAAALQELGVEAGLRGEASLESEREGTGMCFHKSVPVDLCWSNRKGVGSAQRRTRGRVLHHGSIKLGNSPLEGEIATLREHVPGLDAPTLAAHLLTAFRERLGLEFEVSVPTPEERREARELGTRYLSPEFLRRR